MQKEGNLFAESPPLDGLRQMYFMELDAVQSEKNTFATVQSSVWTLQQILPDVPPYSLHITGFMYPNFLQKHYAIYCIGSQKIGRTKKTCS